MKFQFKKYNEPDNLLGILIFARLNNNLNYGNGIRSRRKNQKALFAIN